MKERFVKLLFVALLPFALGGDCFAQDGFGVTKEELDRINSKGAFKKKNNEKFDGVFEKPCLGATLEVWNKALKFSGEDNDKINFDALFGAGSPDSRLFKGIPGECKFYRWEYITPHCIVHAGFWKDQCVAMEINRPHVPFTVDETKDICAKILPGAVFDLKGKNMSHLFASRSNAPSGDYLLRNWTKSNLGYKIELVSLKLIRQIRKEVFSEMGGFTVFPDQSGSVKLTGGDALFYARKQEEKNAAGDFDKWFWGQKGAKAEWSVVIPRTGIYEISVDYSLAETSSGEHPLFLFAGPYGAEWKLDLSGKPGAGKAVICKKYLKRGEYSIALFNGKDSASPVASLTSLNVAPVDEKTVLTSNTPEEIKYQEEKKMSALLGQVGRKRDIRRKSLKDQFIAALKREQARYEKQKESEVAKQIGIVMDDPDHVSIQGTVIAKTFSVNMELFDGKWEKQGEPSDYISFNSKGKVSSYQGSKKDPDMRTYDVSAKGCLIYDNKGKKVAEIKVNGQDTITIRDVRYVRRKP